MYGIVYPFSVAQVDIKIKFEKGTKPTDWTPSPEDIQGNIDTAQSTANSATDKANSVDSKVGTLQTDYNSTKSKVATIETNIANI